MCSSAVFLRKIPHSRDKPVSAKPMIYHFQVWPRALRQRRPPGNYCGVAANMTDNLHTVEDQGTGTLPHRLGTYASPPG